MAELIRSQFCLPHSAGSPVLKLKIGWVAFSDESRSDEIYLFISLSILITFLFLYRSCCILESIESRDVTCIWSKESSAKRECHYENVLLKADRALSKVNFLFHLKSYTNLPTGKIQFTLTITKILFVFQYEIKRTKIKWMRRI